jgi:hypothetical protein
MGLPHSHRGRRQVARPLEGTGPTPGFVGPVLLFARAPLPPPLPRKRSHVPDRTPRRVAPRRVAGPTLLRTPKTERGERFLSRNALVCAAETCVSLWRRAHPALMYIDHQLFHGR